MERGSIYPSWRYHKTEAPELCRTPERDAEMGDDWSDADIRVFPSSVNAQEPSLEPGGEPQKGKKGKKG